MMRARLPSSSVYHVLTIILIFRHVPALAFCESAKCRRRRLASSFNFVRKLVSWSMASPPQSPSDDGIVSHNDGWILSFVGSKKGTGFHRTHAFAETVRMQV